MSGPQLSNDSQSAEALKDAVLNKRLQQRIAADQTGAAQTRIPLADRGEPLPLSHAQQSLWFLHRLDQTAGIAYHIPVGLRLQGTLSHKALRDALDRIVARHESLRTTFVLKDGHPVQCIAPGDCGFALTETDLSGLTPEDKHEAVQHLCTAEAQAPFNLAEGPLCRGQLLRLGDAEHVLLVTMHHIVSDGWSIGVLIKEFSALYGVFTQGLPDPLPPLSLQYFDFVAWQRHRLQGDELQKQTEFWRDHLTGAPTLLELPLDRPRQAVQSYAGASIAVTLDAGLARAIKSLSQKHGMTIFMTLLAGWATLLSRLSGQNDVVIGVPTANRNRSDLENLIGFFVNTLALRVQFGENITTAQLLEQIKATEEKAHANHELPFEQLVDLLNPGRSPSYSPVFQCLFSMNNTPGGGELKLPGLQISAVTASRTTTQFDLMLSLNTGNDSISGSVEYATAIFNHETIARYIEYWKTLLMQMAADDQEPVHQLRLLGGVEQDYLLRHLNDTTTDYPGDGCIHQLFEKQVAKTPHAVAVIYDDRQLTYLELNKKANQLAHYLLSLGARPDDRIAICLERSPEMLVGLLGAMKAGTGYVPLDPKYPAGRLSFMLEDCAPVALLAQYTLLENLPMQSLVRLVLLDGEDDKTAIAQQPDCDLDPATLGLTPRHQVYTIYTSGSTGTPKGVVLEHQQVSNYLHYACQKYLTPESAGSVVSTALSFDATVTTLLAPLLTGKPIFLLKDDDSGLKQLSHKLFESDKPLLFKLTPAHLQALDYLDRTQTTSLVPHCIVIGGEALNVGTLQRWKAALPHARFINEYGPTETTVGCSVYEVNTDESLRSLSDKQSVPIGRPIANTRLYVLNESRMPQPPGVAGELYIGGAGVCRGYFNRPELTAEKFIENPYVPGERLYRSGDRARWLPTDELEFVGRNDDQIKIRGHRVELGEIEHQLSAIAGVNAAVVLAEGDSTRQKRLVAYIAPDDYLVDLNDQDVLAPQLIAQFRKALAARVPDHMIPAAFVLLPKLPLTENGKIDRKSLPALSQSTSVARPYEAPQGKIEIALTDMWAPILGVERIGRRDNFFELGGNSLQVISLIEMLRQKAMTVDAQTVFTAPTIMQLAEAIGSIALPAHAPVPPNFIGPHCEAITPEMLPLVTLTQEEIDVIADTVLNETPNIQDIYPLSPLQEGILFHHVMEQQGDIYLARSIITFDSRKRLASFLDALQQVIDRHDILRSAFVWTGISRAVQVVHRKVTLPVQSLDVSSGENALQKLTNETDPHRIRLDLQRAPLLSAHVSHGPDVDECHLALLYHHMVCDHFTLELIIGEIRTLLTGRGADLAPALPYRNFIARAVSAPVEKHEEYFRSQLSDIDEPTAPFGILEFQSAETQVSEKSIRLDEIAADKIRNAARQHGFTAATLFHLAWAQVLSRCTNQDNVVFGTVLSGRLNASEGADRVLGMFINTLPIRFALKQLTSLEAAADTFERLGKLVMHEQASLVLAQRCSQVEAPLPLFTTLLNYRHNKDVADHDPARRTGYVWEGIKVAAPEERTNYPLLLSIDDSAHGFSITAQCVAGINADRIVGYVATAVEKLADALTWNPEQPLADIDVLSIEERWQLTSGLNNTKTEYPQHLCVHQIFEAQAEKTPDGIAVRSQDRQLTYKQLNKAANQVARHLFSTGVRPDDRVAICVERSPEMIVGLLGVLKAGAAYVPLDPSNPPDRLNTILKDCEPVALITQFSVLENLPRQSLAKLVVLDGDEDGKAIAKQSPENLALKELGLTPRHLAYAIYTSGSTGKPKGVAMPHEPLVNLLFWQHQHDRDPAVAPRTVQASAFSFDVSFQEIFSTLCFGGELVLPNQLIHEAPAVFVELIKTQGVERVFLPFVMLEYLAQASNAMNERLPKLKDIYTAGEQLKITPAVSEFIGKESGRKLHNHYGPTESHVVTAYTLGEDASVWPALPPIGRPIANSQIYILDRHRRPLPFGATGEIFVSGKCLARGYLQQDLTLERFVSDPFSTNPASRLYSTGDLGRYLNDGNIQFIGRNDNQVKVRGYRVELGEIEARLSACDGVKEAVVCIREDNPGEERLVAYVVTGDELKPGTLQAQLATQLPSYMLPAAYVRLDKLPLTATGKIWHKKLPAPDLEAYGSEDFELPQGEVEVHLASIWIDTLKVPRVGRRDNFLTLGGHSLSLVTLMQRISEDMGVEIPLKKLRTILDFTVMAECIVDAQLKQFDPQELARLAGNL